jgi:hypothetical protein
LSACVTQAVEARPRANVQVAADDYWRCEATCVERVFCQYVAIGVYDMTLAMLIKTVQAMISDYRRATKVSAEPFLPQHFAGGWIEGCNNTAIFDSAQLAIQ